MSQQYNTIIQEEVYCENTLSYNNGVLSTDGTEVGVCESTPANLQARYGIFYN